MMTLESLFSKSQIMKEDFPNSRRIGSFYCIVYFFSKIPITLLQVPVEAVLSFQ